MSKKWLANTDWISHAEEISKQNKALSCGSTEPVSQRCSVKNGVLGKFTKFTGKQLCQGLVFDKVTAYQLY